MSESENSENKGGNFEPLQKDNETDVRTAAPTDVSKGNEGSSSGSAEPGITSPVIRSPRIVEPDLASSIPPSQYAAMSDSNENDSGEQRQDIERTTADVGSSGGSGSYPLPSELAQKEREQAAENESSGNSGEQQQESSGEQKQESSGDSGEKKEESSGDSGEQKQESGGDDEKKEEKKSSKPGREHENPDSIPTAGGERLGEKHWGESKIVPDVPKTQKEEEQENVSSAEGQPDQQTKDNTAKNTSGGGGGESHSGGQGGGEDEPKQGMVEKLKDKLGLGKSDS